VRVEVVSYDPIWPEQFAAVRDQLLAELEGVPVRSIEHVGSTSVPGLAAKPRLDVDIVIDADRVPAATAALEAAGYSPLGELGVTDRHAFRAPDHSPPRNVLRRDGRLRDEYGRLKLELAQRDYGDIDQYVVDKSPVIQRILAAAGMDRDELAEIDAMNRLDP
jgi:GrpB-like predicted nucleotidyltransferase (UPF0157 family)